MTLDTETLLWLWVTFYLSTFTELAFPPRLVKHDAQKLSTYFSEEIESWWYRLPASDKTGDRIKRLLLSPPHIAFWAKRWQQQHAGIVKIKSKSIFAPWKRWICFHLVTRQSWCYQAFSESHSHLLTLAFITASKCQWNWMRGGKCYATSISLSQLTTRICQTWTTFITSTINNWSLKFSPAYW